MANGVIKDNGNDVDFPGISGTDYEFTTGTTFAKITTYLPAHDATSIAVGANIVLTFAARVKAGTGNIVLTPSSGSAVNVDVTSNQVTWSTSSPWTATINPTNDLPNNKRYTITMAAGVIKDHGDSSNFAGISGTNYQFVVGTVPTINTYPPAHDATNVAVDANIV